LPRATLGEASTVVMEMTIDKPNTARWCPTRPKVVLSDQPILTPSVGQINGRAKRTPSSSEVRGISERPT
jgi:hypothetical protein